MAERPKVLLVEDDPATLNALRRVLSHERGWEVRHSDNADDGLHIARQFQPDVIISDYDMPETNGFEFCRHIKADPQLAATMFIILTGYNETPLKVRGLRQGVDDYLAKPIEMAELLAKVHAMLRIKGLHDQLRADKAALQRLEHGLMHSFDLLLSVLLYLLDLRMPGAATRGERLAAWARKVAARFDVPERFLEDLRLAALLQEIGRLTEPARRSDVATVPVQGSTDWTYAIATKAILDRVDRLRGAAELVGAIYENWDGTGFPNRLRQGQIPLRSRILRTLIDFFAIVHRQGTNGDDDLVTVLSQHSGTRYDPLVLQHLAVVVGESRDALIDDTYRVAVGELAPGMVLAADLRTASGVKLLSEGFTVTPRSLEVVQSQDAADPIIEGAWVHR